MMLMMLLLLADCLKNEELMRSLLANIAMQVVNGKFAIERYTKIRGKLTPQGREGGGSADICIAKNNKGIVIEMKNMRDNNKNPLDVAAGALKQAKTYAKLIENAAIKIFMSCNITTQKKVFISGEIIVNGKQILFNYPEERK